MADADANLSGAQFNPGEDYFVNAYRGYEQVEHRIRIAKGTVHHIPTGENEITHVVPAYRVNKKTGSSYGNQHYYNMREGKYRKADD